MRFKDDKKFLHFCLEMPDFPEICPLNEVARDLCALFVKAGMLQNIPDEYGATMGELIGDKSPADVCAILAPYMRVPVTVEILNAFCGLTVIGDGLCPHCGGELKFVETEGHELHDGTHDVPNSYIIDKYVYTCPLCGETIKSDKQL